MYSTFNILICIAQIQGRMHQVCYDHAAFKFVAHLFYELA